MRAGKRDSISGMPRNVQGNGKWTAATQGKEESCLHDNQNQREESVCHRHKQGILLHQN